MEGLYNFSWTCQIYKLLNGVTSSRGEQTGGNPGTLRNFVLEGEGNWKNIVISLK